MIRYSLSIRIFGGDYDVEEQTLLAITDRDRCRGTRRRAGRSEIEQLEPQLVLAQHEPYGLASQPA
jgi:hypothetical protein